MERNLAERLKDIIRVIPDFPQPGISFKDLTTLMLNGKAFREAITELGNLCRPLEADLVVGPEARGFIIGAPLAYNLGIGFVPVRKQGKLPGHTHKQQYQLEYGFDVLEVHQEAIAPGKRVLVVDDLLATGGTVRTAIDLVEKCGGQVVAAAFLVELTYLPGRARLADYPVISLIKY